MKQFDEYSYHCGVMDAFAEAVGAGVKQMALSHPFLSVQEMNAYLPYAKQLCDRYHIKCFEETELLITDLFPISMNKGKCNIIFVKDQSVYDQYIKLKQEKHEYIQKQQYSTKHRMDIALSFGALLSYTKEACLEKISSNMEKEGYKHHEEKL